MIFICLTIVDFPLSPDPKVKERQAMISQTERNQSGNHSNLPSSRILHSFRKRRESSSNLRSIAWLCFFCSASPVDSELKHEPIFSFDVPDSEGSQPLAACGGEQHRPIRTPGPDEHRRYLLSQRQKENHRAKKITGAIEFRG